MSNYRNIELSDPRFERDHLRFLTFKSRALRGRGDVTLFVPPGCERKKNMPLVVLLHGVYGSHWAWAFKGGAHRTALRLIEQKQIPPMVLAMPSDGLWGDGTAFLPLQFADFERWIMDDVVGCVTEVVPCLGRRSKLFLTGLSMGGFGALRLGAKYAERVAGISAHSSATHLAPLTSLVEETEEDFGPLAEEEREVFYWMRLNKDKLPPLRFDCGRDDKLAPGNRELHRVLEREGIPHEYIEYEGTHSWAYWEEHIADSLRFFGRLAGTAH